MRQHSQRGSGERAEERTNEKKGKEGKGERKEEGRRAEATASGARGVRDTPLYTSPSSPTCPGCRCPPKAKLQEEKAPLGLFFSEICLES